MSKNTKSIVLDYLKIFTGVTLLAAAITVFFEPNGIVTGGVSGLSIIISHYVESAFSVDLPLSVLNIVLNLPLLILGFSVLGRSFIWRTLVATLYLSAALAVTALLPSFEGDFVIISVFGGALMGLGIGFTLAGFATTGGSDLCAAIIHKNHKSVSVANAMFAIDSAVIAAGFLAFGVERGLYAIIAVFISSKVIDAILEGLSFSKGVFIISGKAAEIAADVLKTMERGVTGLSGRGMYTKNELNVLMCVVSKKEVATLKNIVKNHDADAFMIITDVREALGEGFGEH